MSQGQTTMIYVTNLSVNKDSNALSEVICPVTEAKFTLVRKEIPESIVNLSKWADDILSRVNDGKNINIAVDCEGYFLGCIKNSLSTIQIGEIFDDFYDVWTNDSPPSVGQKPGFIILAPFSKEVIQILSSILNNSNVMIYTFDFISDFTTMIEIGIQINMNNVFDSQTATFSKDINFFQAKDIKSLTWFVQQAKNMDPLGKKACETKNQDKKNYFFVTSYLFKDKKHPEREIMNKDLFEMGSADVYFTGLAAIYCIKSNLRQRVLSFTNIKIKQFNKLVKKMRPPLGPSLARQLFFFDTFSAEKYKKTITMKNEKESDLIDLLIVFKNTFTVISAYKILMDKTKCKLDFDRAKNIYIETIQNLDAKKDSLIEMMEKYA